MRNSFTARGLAIVLLGVATTVLLTATMVLGLTGAVGASTWTGTAGVVLLAVWLVVANGRPTRRVRRLPEEVTATPLAETART
jgi:hypothetical protein